MAQAQGLALPLRHEALAHLFANQSRRKADLPTLDRYLAFLNEYSTIVVRIPIHHPQCEKPAGT